MTNNGIYFVWVITQNFFLISCGVKRFLVRIWKKKRVTRKMTSLGKLLWAKKQNVHHLPEATLDPHLRHVQSTLVRLEWLQNNIFWMRTITKTRAYISGVHAWLSVLTKTGHSWSLDCWCWAFMTSSSRRSHKTRKPALKQTPSDYHAFLHHTLIREVKQTSIKTHHNMWAIDVRIHVYKI